MRPLQLKKKRGGDEEPRRDPPKRQHVSSSGSTDSSRRNVERPAAPQQLPPRPSSRPSGSSARPSQPPPPASAAVVPASRLGSQDKGKAVASSLPPSLDLDPAVLMGLPEHLRVVVNLMSQDFTAANWKDLDKTNWLEAMKGLFSSANSIVFTLAHILEPATAAKNIEDGLRAEQAALRADFEKARLEKAKAVEMLERYKTKVAEIITARDRFKAEVKTLEEKSQKDLKGYQEALLQIISDYKKTTEFKDIPLRAVLSFKDSPEMKAIVEKAEERGAKAWRESEEFAMLIENTKRQAVGDWKESEEYTAAIAKAEAEGAEDLLYTIGLSKPELDFSFLYDAPPSTPLPANDEPEVAELTTSLASVEVTVPQAEEQVVVVPAVAESSGQGGEPVIIADD